MRVLKSVEKVRMSLLPEKLSGKTIGLVPTMGYLHEGHESLIKKCREENDIVVVSIFVNPTQFGEGEDFDDYPRDMQRDLKICKSLNVDLVFNPEENEIYDNHKTYVDIRGLSENLCGKSRPGHFKGVCTIVSKLFNIILPDRAYFGEKDAQQLYILKKMVKDLNFDVEIVGCPIIRDEDGLAKSSRNKYLSEEERESALSIYKAIKKAKDIIKIGMDSEDLIKEMEHILIKEDKIKIDYIEVVDLENLEKVTKVKNDILVALSAYIGETRLIDNFIYEGICDE